MPRHPLMNQDEVDVAMALVRSINPGALAIVNDGYLHVEANTASEAARMKATCAGREWTFQITIGYPR